VAGDNTWYNPVVSSNGLVMAVTGIASVQVSEDGGVTWANRPIGPDQYSDITDLTMSDSGDLMLVLIGNKIYLSTDKGITWTNKVVFSDNPIDGEMSSNGQVMAVVSTHGSVAYSTDFGQTWVWSSTSAVPVGYVVLDFSCNRNDCSKWVVTRSGSASVVKSINHGSTWTNSAATPITIYKLGAVAISDDGQVILVHNNDSSSYDKLLRSANFGSLPWTVYSAANFNDIRADGIVIKGSRVSYISGSSRLVTSGDLGITWSGSSLASGYLWSDINLASSSSNVYLGTTVNESFNNKFGYIHTSSDSGSTFVIRKPNYIDRSFNNLQGSLTIAPNAAAAWAFPSGPMRRSINRGQIWESNYVINVYYVGSAWSINRIISSNQNLWKLECAGTSCNLNKFSFDAGGSVSAQQLVSSSAGQIRTDIAVDASGQKVINTLGGASQVNYSFDGGTSWQAMTIDDFMLSSSYYFGAVAISQNGNHLAVCVLSNDNDKLLLNSGNFNNISDWRVKSLPTGYRCLDHGTLAISNSGQIIALANTYVGVSKDGGQTWTRDNLSNGGGSYRRLVCDQNCTVIMAVKEKVIKSHVVKSVNGGDTWQLDQDLGEEYWSDIAISGDGSLIIAAPRYGQLRVAN